MASFPQIQTVVIHGLPASVKYFNLGTYNVLRKERSSTHTIGVINRGQSELLISGIDYILAEGSLQPGWKWGYVPYGESRLDIGFDFKQLVQFPLIVPPSNQTNNSLPSYDGFEVIPILTVSFTGDGLSPEEANTAKSLSAQIIVNSNDLNEDLPDDGDYSRSGIRITRNRVIIEASITGNRKRNSDDKIIYRKNIHGYLETPKIRNKEVWSSYAKQRINDALNPNQSSGIKRITISDFLDTKDFVNNGVFDDRVPEEKRVFNRFKDPLPPYDFLRPIGDNYVFNGVRRTIDYAGYLKSRTSRVDTYYTEARKYFGWNTDKSLIMSNDFIRELQSKFGITISATNPARQRREWGFREKMIQGFPYFFPKVIQPMDSAPSPLMFDSPNRNFTCGRGPVIAGFVTAGSGIFSGIPSSANIEYDYNEVKRTVNSPTDVPHGKPRIPTGLIFIQDETGAIGFSLGTDMRYMENPLYHNANFAEPSIPLDKMHLGSIGIPKADYRQFLREGDLVVIELGIGFKYWHPVLGSEPRYWESLIGRDEYDKLERIPRTKKIETKSETISVVEKYDPDFPGIPYYEKYDGTNWTDAGEKLIDVEIQTPINNALAISEPTTPTYFIPPYVDNWGAYTDRGSNNGMELAIEDPTGIFVNPARAMDFDAANLNDESLANYVTSLVGIINSAVEGARRGYQIGGPFGLIIGALVSGTVTAFIVYNAYYRERYVLRSRSIRDGQFPYTTFYPIQEYHPWSTGTPIPIDNGMPYIMSDVFTVDTGERFAIPPKEITAAQLRGIPVNTHELNPQLEWSLPKQHLESVYGGVRKVIRVSPVTGLPTEDFEYVENPNNPYKPNVENFIKEFHGIEGEPITPFTANPGSKYKGQLVRIKNVRFVKPPTYKYFVPSIASDVKRQLFINDKDKILSELRKWIDDGNSITDFRVQLLDIPDIDLDRSKLTDDIATTIQSIFPAYKLQLSILRTFFTESLTELLGETSMTIINSALSEVEQYMQYIVNVQNKIEEMVNTGVSGFTSEAQILEFIAVKHRIDYNGMRMDVDMGHELYQLAHRAFGDISIGNALSQLGIVAVTEILNYLGLGFLGNLITSTMAFIDTMKIAEVPETNQYAVGFTDRKLIYEVTEAVSDFPLSVDRKNGGYWWADPNIPLTNARSHVNDANYGNPETESDNEGNLLYPNQDIMSTSRTVFTQLVSSNKTRVSIPIWDIYDGDLADRYGKSHVYDMSYIQDRYVKDLGGEYSGSYEPFAEEWKPYRYIDGTIQVPNTFEPIEPGLKFSANKVYYVMDENNVVIPIRINANTEIARYMYDVPTGSIDITGIAWQYSMGTPGLEWEREAYIMQIWPRYLSDVGLKLKEEDISVPPPEPPTVTPPVVTPPTPPSPPRRLPDIRMPVTELPINSFTCETLQQMFRLENERIKMLKEAMNWPVDETSESTTFTIRKDPITGRTVAFPNDPVALRRIMEEPLYPCEGMQIGQEQFVIVTSANGATRTFFFYKDENGNCVCARVENGTNVGRIEPQLEVGTFPVVQNNDGITQETQISAARIQ